MVSPAHNKVATAGSQAGRRRAGRGGATLKADIGSLSTAMRILVALLLVLILFSLLSGLVYLVRDRGRGERAVKALTWRIGLSIALFLALMAAYCLGLIQPTGT
jgi:hypothetical protein